MSVDDVLRRTGPRKLLALDGGGIRGLISIGVLASMERQLRALTGNPSLVLADYFDYIGGTSTGAILAACLSKGMSVDEIRDFYTSNSSAMFKRAPWWMRLAHHLYRRSPLSDKLREIFPGMTLGSNELRTLLLIVLRNAATDSPWPVSNNPRAKYNQRDLPDCNLDLPLWQLVRGSTAAPTYFWPEMIQVGPRLFTFVDGGITPYNNPAFQLFLMATLEPYALQWQASTRDMLLMSIGTGSSEQAMAKSRFGMHKLYQAKGVPHALMNAAAVQQDVLCRVFGDCRFGDPIDSELLDLIGVQGPSSKLFTYARYDVALTKAGLERCGCGSIDPSRVAELDAVGATKELLTIGESIGKNVKPEHFAGFV